MVSTPVLATKLFAPARRPQLVARPRLVERLDTTLDAGHRLTLVSAPAGFGKTTLLGDWLAHLESRRRRPGRRGCRSTTATTTWRGSWPTWWPPCGGVGLDVDAGARAAPAASTATALTALVNDVVRAGEHAPDNAVGPRARRLPRRSTQPRCTRR